MRKCVNHEKFPTTEYLSGTSYLFNSSTEKLVITVTSIFSDSPGSCRLCLLLQKRRLSPASPR